MCTCVRNIRAVLLALRLTYLVAAFSTLIFSTLLPASCAAADARDIPRSKSEIERKAAEQKRKFEQTQRELKAKQ
jgi:hypothetical protein